MDDHTQLDRVIKLFTGPNSDQLHERHCASIDRLCECTSGFAIADLPKVEQILELTFGLLASGFQGFLEPACKLLRALSKPFVKRSATDDSKLVGNIISIVAAVGKALVPGFHYSLQVAAAEMLRAFATAHGPRPHALELASASIDVADAGSPSRQYLTNQSLVVQSGVAEAVVRGLAASLLASDQLLILTLSATLQSFSYLPPNCKQLVDVGVLACLPPLLSLGYKHDVTPVAVELLWNLLEKCPIMSCRISEPQPLLSRLAGASSLPEQHHCDGTAAAEEAPVSEPLAAALSSLFRMVLVQGFREADKELRNNILVVINLLGTSPPFVGACHASGLFEALLAISCAPECCNGMPHVKPWALSTEELDLELKLLCWSAATAGCVQLPQVLDLANSTGLMSLLLQYLDVTCPPPAVQRWNADRISTLRSTALSMLLRIAPISVEVYLSSGGVPVVLAMLAHCAVPSHVEAAVKLLNALCSSAPAMAEELGAGGAVGLLLELAQRRPGWPDSVSQSALLLLALMCTGSGENLRRLRKAQGISVLLDGLAQVSTLDPALPSPLVLATLNAVWCCIVPDRKNVANFLVAEGMDVLISLLERGHRAHRPLLLSVLTDMLQNPRTLPFFHDWRSDLNQQAAAHLLITFWKEEDSLRGMTVEGVLANTIQPLKGLDKRTCWVTQESVMYGNILPERRAQLLAITGACSGEDVLTKIYTVLKLVGMGSLDYISLEDQAMLCLIEKYIKFRQGDMWRQMKAEFEAEGMRPTAADRARLDSGLELSENLAQAVRDAQQNVLGRHLGVVKQKEAKFFEDMDAQKKLEQEMRFYQKDKTQLSVAELRAAKQKKEQMLKNSHNLARMVQDPVDPTAC